MVCVEMQILTGKTFHVLHILSHFILGSVSGYKIIFSLCVPSSVQKLGAERTQELLQPPPLGVNGVKTSLEQLGFGTGQWEIKAKLESVSGSESQTALGRNGF